MAKNSKGVEIIELDSSDEETSREHNMKHENSIPPTKTQSTADGSATKQESHSSSCTPSQEQEQHMQSNAIDTLLTAYERCYERLTSLEMSMTPQQCRRWLQLNRRAAEPGEQSGQSDLRFQPNLEQLYKSRLARPRPRNDYQGRYSHNDQSRPSSSNYSARSKPRAKAKPRKKTVKKRAQVSTKKSYVTKKAVAASKAKMVSRITNLSASTSSSSSVNKPRSNKPVKVKTEHVRIKSEAL